MKREIFQQACEVDKKIEQTNENIAVLTEYEVHSSFNLMHLKDRLNLDSLGLSEAEIDSLYNKHVEQFVVDLLTHCKTKKKEYQKQFETI